LPAIPNLLILNLSGNPRLTNAGLVNLWGMKIQSLNLSFCSNLRDGVLTNLSEVIDLQELDLSGCDNITNNGLADLGVMVNLKALSLSHCGITDYGLSYLNEANLITLDLSNCHNLTDDGLGILSSTPSLREVNLSGCSGLNPAAIEKFQADLAGRRGSNRESELQRELESPVTISLPSPSPESPQGNEAQGKKLNCCVII
jgi:hypothetical protein